MNYRSIFQMNEAILNGLHRIPNDVDLIVGVPRSGMIAAELLALLTNAQLADLDSYIDGKIYTPGVTKSAGMKNVSGGKRTVVVIDDSINGGDAMKNARARIEAAGKEDNIIYTAVYGSKPDYDEADIVFETVPWPRIFQWNFMHHKFLQDSCLDIDGVLCHDPLAEDNDDGPRYETFLSSARPLYNFSRPLGILVTSRLEKYRRQTEAWLAEQNIQYKELRMLDLPSKEERQRLNAHGSFKGQVYRESDAILFIESENAQARKIAELAGKPVLCLQTHTLVRPTEKAVVSRLLHEEEKGARKLVKFLAYSLIGRKNAAHIKRLLSK